MEKVNVGIVGCGFIAEQYAAAIADYSYLNISATCDLDVTRAQALADTYGAQAYTELDALLADSNTDIIVNLTIHSAHHAITKQCLTAGKHVFSEKPLALTAADADELVALAKANDLLLSCAPDNVAADAQQLTAKLLHEHAIGSVKVVYADCSLGRVPAWNSNPEHFLNIGPLWDGAVYPLNLLISVFGPVKRVLSAHHSLLLPQQTHNGRVFNVQTPDHSTAILEMENGVQVRLTASMYTPYQSKHFYSIEFHGDDGSLYLGNCGDLSWQPDAVELAPIGQGYTGVSLEVEPAPRTYGSAVADMALALRGANEGYIATGQRAAAVVAAIEAMYAFGDNQAA